MFLFHTEGGGGAAGFTATSCLSEPSTQMKSQASITLARLRACRWSGKPVPAQVIDDAIEALGRIEARQIALMRRDDLIRAAAEMTGQARASDQAKQLLATANALSRTWPTLVLQSPPDVPATARDALHAARLVAPLPKSTRQFLRVLAARS